MVQTILFHFKADDPSNLYSARQYLKKSDLREFLSVLFDTTIARSSSGHHEQLLDVFYGTLMVCMIKTLFFSISRYSIYDYKPLHPQAYDPTFLDRAKCQLYLPMLLSLAHSKATFEGGNAYLFRASCAIEVSDHPSSVDMHTQAAKFIGIYSRPFCASKSFFSGLE